MTKGIVKLLFISSVFFTTVVNSFGCDSTDAESIDIIAINNQGIDFVVLCNSSTLPVSLNGMITIEDKNQNVESIQELTIPAQSCIRLVRHVDFTFNLEDDDGFTISCDGTLFATASSVGRGLTILGTAPVRCDAALASSISITGIMTGTGIDRAIVCNSSDKDVVLSGVTVSNRDQSSEIPFLIVPANACVTLINTRDFFFGLSEGSPDSFTITCGGTEIDSQSWTPSDLGPNGEISFGLADCDPGLSSGSIYISSIVVDSSIVDQVVVCNPTAALVSLNGTDVVDSGNGGTNPQLELLVGLSIQPFSCITLIRDIDFTFGLSEADAFSISCMGTEIVAAEWDETMLNSTGALLFLQAPPVNSPTIPSMGEWGLISLGFLLMIFAVVWIREDTLVFS